VWIYKFNLYVGNIKNWLNKLAEYNEAELEFYRQYEKEDE